MFPSILPVIQKQNPEKHFVALKQLEDHFDRNLGSEVTDRKAEGFRPNARINECSRAFLFDHTVLHCSVRTKNKASLGAEIEVD